MKKKGKGIIQKLADGGPISPLNSQNENKNTVPVRYNGKDYVPHSDFYAFDATTKSYVPNEKLAKMRQEAGIGDGGIHRSQSSISQEELAKLGYSVPIKKGMETMYQDPFAATSYKHVGVVPLTQSSAGAGIGNQGQMYDQKDYNKTWVWADDVDRWNAKDKRTDSQKAYSQMTPEEKRQWNISQGRGYDAQKILTEKKAKGGIIGKVQKLAPGGPVDPNEQAYEKDLADAQKRLEDQERAKSGNLRNAQIAGAGIQAGSELGAALITQQDRKDGQGSIAGSGASGLLSGTGKGAAMGANPALMAATGGASVAIGAGIMGTIGLINGVQKGVKERDDILSQAREESASDALANMDKKNYTGKSTIDTSKQQKKTLGIKGLFAKGGEIKGPGGPTEDKINASVPAGSFIVPAANADKAKELRAMYLPDKNPGKAPVNQGGAPVKLSDGEHMFTPEEWYMLQEKGIDLWKLAPEAEDRPHLVKNKGGQICYADGGPVQQEDPLKAIEEERKKSRKTYDSQKEEKFKKDVTKFKYDVAKEYMDAVSGKKETIKELNEALKKFKSYSDDPSNDESRRYYWKIVESLEKKVKDYDNQIETKKDVASKVLTGKPAKGVVESVKKTTPTTTGVTSTAKKPANPIAENLKEKSDIPAEKKVNVSGAKKPGNGIKSALSSTKSAASTESAKIETETNTAHQYNADEENVVINPEKKKEEPYKDPQLQFASGEEKKKNFGGLKGLLNETNGYKMLALTQAGVGAQALLKDGKRPVDKIDPTFDRAVNQSISDSGYGLSPEAMQLQKNNILQNRSMDFANIKNAAAGNGAVALGNSRIAAMNANNAMLGLSIEDQKLRTEKKRYANEMIDQRAEKRRRLFGDKMAMFQQNQEAGANLLSAGLANYFSANRYQKELENNNDVEKTRNSYLGTI